MASMSLRKVAMVVRKAEAKVCSRIWETFREFQDSLETEQERDLVDRLEVLLRENVAYEPEEVKDHD